LADRSGAELLLRIDDLDSDRKRPEYVQDIFESLDWLQIKWERGPQNPDEFERDWSQHIRMEQYKSALEELTNRQLLFACRCSRKQLSSDSNRYPETCAELHLPLDTPDTTLRLTVPADKKIEFHDRFLGSNVFQLVETTGSFVVRRRDGLPAYQLASVVDDRLFGITGIVRGTDLLSSTAAQLYLAAQIGFPAFAEINFFHHELIPDEHGNKLSKSEGALSLKALRSSGVTFQEILQRLEPLFNRYLVS
jgi:glutamyl/glutaminyl-tRNA synthetase